MHLLSRSPLALILTLPLLALPLTLAAGPADAAARTDLKITSVRTDVTAVVRGRSVEVSDSTRNVGKGTARSTRTAYYLSPNRSWSRSDTKLATRKVKKLKARRTSSATRTVTIPASTAAGTWWVIACADATTRVREKREGNNCRAASQALRVTVPAPPPKPPTPPTPPGAVFPQTPNPWAPVSSTLDTGRAVSGYALETEDQTITTAAADGTVFTLAVPAGAIFGAEKITLTPVTAVTGTPFAEGLSTAVQIEPHGLMLLEPATLTITRPADAGGLGATSAQSPVLFHDGGTDLHSYPVLAPLPEDDTNTVRLALTHFSTAGVANATDAERTTLADHAPTRTVAQLEAANAALLHPGASTDVLPQVAANLDAYYDSVLTPQLIAAETDADLAAEAVAAALAWSRQVQLLGDEDNPRHADVLERVERILANVVDEAWQDCLDHDLLAIQKLVRVARAAALLGFDFSDDAFDKFLRCDRFEMTFTSEHSSAHSYSGSLQSGSTTIAYATSATVTVNGLTDNWSKAGPVSFTSFSYFSENLIHDSDPECYSSTVGTGAYAPGKVTASVVPTLTINVREGDREEVVLSAGLIENPGPTAELRRTGCDGGTSTQTAEFASLGDGIRSWESTPAEQQGELIDTESWDEFPSEGVHDQGTIEIRHVPLP